MTNHTDNLNFFLEQIQEDINNIKIDWGEVDKKLLKDEYAFNFWILSRIFSIDEDVAGSYITEYNDKGIDCFVHFEESKELYIVQNKYYKNAAVNRGMVADFLHTSISVLINNKYKKSLELQNIFNKAKDDTEYKIYFYFFATTDNISGDINDLIKQFNNTEYNLKCFVDADFFGLSKLHDLYYGKNYGKKVRFEYALATPNKGTFLSLRENYGIDPVYEAYYIATPVSEIYKMLLDAENQKYPIFDKNIREYLGNNVVNNGIVDTLRSKTERKNFIYYNNGITVICEEILPPKINTSGDKIRKIPLVNPQIVNGCQTVSSIKKVLENVRGNIAEEYKNVYVMLKALIIKNPEEEENHNFYYNVVKYTNKQNAVSPKAFSANFDLFYRLQDEFKKRGFILLVKPSDANTFKTTFNDIDKGNLVKKAQKTLSKIDYKIDKYADVCIQLEKLLQVFIAFIKNGYIAFTKKNLVLAQGKELFEDYSSQIHKYLRIDNMIKLYYLYKKAEIEQKKSIDKRTPIPYYVISFLGDFIGDKNFDNIQKSLDIIFSEQDKFNETYNYLAKISQAYRMNYISKSEGDSDYNVMIKKPIDNNCLNDAIRNAAMFGQWKYLEEWKNV